MPRTPKPYRWNIFLGKRDGRVYANLESRNGVVTDRLSGGKNGGYSDARYVRTIIRAKVAEHAAATGTVLQIHDETISATSAKANATKVYNLAHGAKHKPRGSGRAGRRVR